MPNAKITSITVSQNWDDDSSSKYEVSCEEDSEGNLCVDLSGCSDKVRIHEESWPLIRSQIDSFFSET